jgi:Domain of unknown function (DUF4411)
VTTYLLDANVFIQAKNSHYAFDIVPAFWQWLEQAHRAGTVFTVEKVGDEILPGGDALATWMKNLPKEFRIGATPADQPSLQSVSS